jgi:glycerol-3-phosphate dehydrogenase
MDLDMPIIYAVHDIDMKGEKASDVIRSLMARAMKSELHELSF